MTKAVLGIIGGSGIYDLPGLEDAREERIASPWGEPSGPLRIGQMAQSHSHPVRTGKGTSLLVPPRTAKRPALAAGVCATSAARAHLSVLKPDVLRAHRHD